MNGGMSNPLNAPKKEGRTFWKRIDSSGSSGLSCLPALVTNDRRLNANYGFVNNVGSIVWLGTTLVILETMSP